MNERIFNTGDTVVLKSGGSIMTVKNYTPLFSLKEPDLRSKTDVICTWFENGIKQQGTFKQDMLKFAV